MARSRRFALIGHGRDARHCYSALSKKELDAAPFSQERAFDLMEATGPYVADFWGPYLETEAVSISGFQIIIAICPEFMRRRPKAAIAKIRMAVAAAASLGATVVTLGGLTSVLFRQEQTRAARSYRVAITSGNALTAAMTVRTVEEAARLRGLDLEETTVAILGAAGDIGSACSLVFCRRAHRLILAGRREHPLNQMAARCSSSPARAELSVRTDLKAAVRDADIVIAATSTPNLPLEPSSFKEEAIVCDVGYPRNIDRKTCARSDLWIFDGGLVSLPRSLPSQCDTGLPSPEICFGCYAEAIVLALEGAADWSDGTAITLERMEELYRLALRHGFTPALPPFSYKRPADGVPAALF
jgi:fatty aldehyde-generating acyl-ACP reductase